MENNKERKIYTIDATDQSFGRLASKAVNLLRGKNKASFAPHLDEGSFVQITHINKAKITGNKMEGKIYFHYSGYPGGMKEKKLKDVLAKDPGEVLRRAVYGMLPKNKLRREMLKRLTVL